MHNLHNHIKIPCLHFLIMIGLPLPIINRARIKNDQFLWHRYVGHQHVRKFCPVVNFSDGLFFPLDFRPLCDYGVGKFAYSKVIQLGNWSLLPIPRHTPLEIQCSMVGMESEG